MRFTLTPSQVARLRAYRNYSLAQLLGTTGAEALRSAFPIVQVDNDTWEISDDTLVIIAATPQLPISEDLLHVVQRASEKSPEQFLADVKVHWENHETFCCREHKTHAMPHRQCILR